MVLSPEHSESHLLSYKNCKPGHQLPDNTGTEMQGRMNFKQLKPASTALSALLFKSASSNGTLLRPSLCFLFILPFGLFEIIHSLKS